MKFGRYPRLTPEQIVLALHLVDEGQSVPQVAEAFGVHHTTIYRYLSATEGGRPTAPKTATFILSDLAQLPVLRHCGC